MRLLRLFLLSLAVAGCDGWKDVYGEGELALPLDAYSWTRLPFAGAAARDLVLPRLQSDGEHLWAVGRNGVILHSANAGKDWERQPTGTTQSLFAIFGKGQRLWAVGDSGLILHSPNGGRLWQKRKSGTDASIHAIDGDGTNLWVVGSDGTILHSGNGGLDWQRQGPNLTDRLVQVLEENDSLWVVGEDGLVLRSSDGGRSWRDTRLDASEDLVGVHRNGQRIWVIGEWGALFHSEDGGESWRKGGLEVEDDGADRYFLDIAGDGARLWVISDLEAWYSADGGQAWNPLPNLSAAEFSDLRVEGERVWLVGSWRQEEEEEMGESQAFFSARPALVRGDATERFAYRILDRWRMRGGIGRLRVEMRHRTHPRADSTLPPPRLELSLAGADSVAADDGLFEPIPVRTEGLLSSADFDAGEAIDLQPGERLYLRVTTAQSGFRQSYLLSARYFPWWDQYRRELLIAGAILALLLAYRIVLLRWPLSLLWIERWLPVTELVGLLPRGDALQDWFGRTLLARLVYRPRVLDAWVERHAAAAGGQRVEVGAPKRKLPLERIWGSYAELPVGVDSGEASGSACTPGDLRSLLRGPRSALEIVGPAGSGKTTLAAWIAQGALAADPSRRILPHRAFPLFVDEDADDLLELVRGKLDALVPDGGIKTGLVLALLRERRTLLVFDGLSERSEAMQRYVQTIYRRHRANAFVVTTRREMEIEGVETRLLRPGPLREAEPLRALEVGPLDPRRSAAEATGRLRDG